jgi:hypothetical protein
LKKFENHAYSEALFAMHYNFVKIHSTPRGVRNGGWREQDSVGHWGYREAR